MTTPHHRDHDHPWDDDPFDGEAIPDDGYEVDEPTRIALWLGHDPARQQPDVPLPIEWRALSTTEAGQQIRLLEGWVAWLVDRYDLDHRHVPDCWNRHPALIEELSALRTARTLAYDPNTPGSEPLHWHERFAAARHRLTDWVARTGCRPGEHRNR